MLTLLTRTSTWPNRLCVIFRFPLTDNVLQTSERWNVTNTFTSYTSHRILNEKSVAVQLSPSSFRKRGVSAPLMALTLSWFPKLPPFLNTIISDKVCLHERTYPIENKTSTASRMSSTVLTITQDSCHPETISNGIPNCESPRLRLSN